MTPPPSSIDGTDITGATIDGQEVQEITVDGQTVFTAINKPDTVISRPLDTGAGGPASDKRGLQVRANSDFDVVGARISRNTSGVTRAYLFDVSAGGIIDETDLSGLSGGDTFKLSASMSAGQLYNILCDAEGSGYTIGFLGGSGGLIDNNKDFDIEDGINNTTQSASYQVVNDIGNPDGVLD